MGITILMVNFKKNKSFSIGKFIFRRNIGYSRKIGAFLSVLTTSTFFDCRHKAMRSLKFVVVIR